MIEITAMIGVVVGISQIAKTTGLQTKYIPVFNLTLGITLGVLFLSQDTKMNIFQGIIIGLSASGLFDHTKIMKRMTISNEKKCKYILSIFVTMILIVTIETNAFADRTLLIPELPKQPFRYGVGAFEGVVAHSTATPEAPAINIQKYESRTWRSAFVHYAVDWEEKIQIASIKYRAWGQVQQQILDLFMLNCVRQVIHPNSNVLMSDM